MHFVGHHYDGFTPDLLKWKIEIYQTSAFVEASWSIYGAGKTNARAAAVRLDRSRLPAEADLRIVQMLDHRYESGLDDVGSLLVAFDDGGQRWASEIDGGVDLNQYPELPPFLAVWSRIDEVVFAALCESGFERSKAWDSPASLGSRLAGLLRRAVSREGQ